MGWWWGGCPEHQSLPAEMLTRANNAWCKNVSHSHLRANTWNPNAKVPGQSSARYDCKSVGTENAFNPGHSARPLVLMPLPLGGDTSAPESPVSIFWAPYTWRQGIGSPGERRGSGSLWRCVPHGFRFGRPTDAQYQLKYRKKKGQSSQGEN